MTDIPKLLFLTFKHASLHFNGSAFGNPKSETTSDNVVGNILVELNLGACSYAACKTIDNNMDCTTQTAYPKILPC